MNGIRLKIAVATAILTLAAIQSMHRVALAQLEIVAISGNTSPDVNGTFSTFGIPTVTDGGIAFTATLTGTTGGANDDTGIYRLLNDPLIQTLIQIAREGQPAPDGNGVFSHLAFGAPEVPRPTFAFGGTMFAARLTGTSGGASDNFGIFRGNGDTLTQIVRKGQPSPDGHGTFHEIDSFNTNGSGQAAFVARFIPAFPAIDGVFLGSGGPITQIAGVPGGDPTYFGPVGPVPINELGQVAFQGSVGGNFGLLRGGVGGTAQIARIGQPAPDGNGTFITFYDNELSINDFGRVAFTADLDGTSGGASDNQGLFIGNGGTLEQIAREGQPAPDGNGVFSNFRLRGGPALDRSGGGRVAFVASLRETSGGMSDDEGLFVGFGGGSVPVTNTVVRKGQPAPDGDGTFFSFQDFALDAFGLGNLAFWASLTGTSGAQGNDSGIFLTKGGEILQVVREGDPLAGSTIAALAFNGSDAPSGDVGSGLHFSGRELAFHARLADGRQAIVLYTVPGISNVTGDYNLDGIVGAADYVVWRKLNGELVPIPNHDPNDTTPGAVDQEDYDHWRANFGRSSNDGNGGGGTADPSDAVPEPASLTILLLTVGILLPVLRQRNANVP